MTATSKRAPSGALDRYLRHAERYGVELVFETAAGLVAPFRAELSDRELGRLAVELRVIDPHWQLPKGENDREVRDPVDGSMKSPGGFEIRRLNAADFALRLVADGVREVAAARMAGISSRTLQRRQRPARELLRQAQQVAKPPSEPAFHSGVHATNPGAEGDWSPSAHLSPIEARR